ncbi:MAG: hypothetical protein ACPGUV_09940 [Polyangiales bacterium]
MRRGLRLALGAVLLLVPVALVLSWVSAAESRLAAIESGAAAEQPAVAVAKAANEAYCTPELQRILRRVLQSCGLIGGRAGRGCKPLEARQVATMGGDDFNSLFTPMQERGGIVQFGKDSAELDDAARRLIEEVFAQRRGASYFFVVARASPEGAPQHNQELSRRRAEAVLAHLQSHFSDPELERQVGLLWLGEEFAQLETRFCDWRRSGTSQRCRARELNRSAFVAWIDCRL